MHQNEHVIDLIERAWDKQPACSCGRNTTVVWRDGIIWLECASLTEPRHGRIARLFGDITAPVHLHEAIVDAPAQDPVSSVAA